MRNMKKKNYLLQNVSIIKNNHGSTRCVQNLKFTLMKTQFGPIWAVEPRALF